MAIRATAALARPRKAGRARILPGMFLAAWLVSAPAFADWTAEQQAVIDAMQAWETAVEQRDYDALANRYTDDAIYYPHGRAPLIGREAIMESQRSRGTRGDVDIVQQVDDVSINGDWAVYSCRASVRVAGADPEAAVREVRVLLVMERGEDGVWRIHRDIDNVPPATEDGP